MQYAQKGYAIGCIYVSTSEAWNYQCTQLIISIHYWTKRKIAWSVLNTTAQCHKCLQLPFHGFTNSHRFIITLCAVCVKGLIMHTCLITGAHTLHVPLRCYNSQHYWFLHWLVPLSLFLIPGLAWSDELTMSMLARQTVRCWGGSRFFTSALSSHSCSSSTCYMVSITTPFKGGKVERLNVVKRLGYDGSFRYVACGIDLWHFRTSIPANKARIGNFLLDWNVSLSSDIVLPGSPKV